jgi:lysophospholipase L1-like esterase
MIWRYILLNSLLFFALHSNGFDMLDDNDRIVFFGDSITLLGVKPNGYITLIKDSLSKKFPSIEIIGAGIGGNKVPDLLARIDSDVIARNPTIVVIYIGINDVWHFITPGQVGTSKDVYEAGLEKIIGKIQKTGARIILCTPTVIGEKKNGKNQLDAQLNEYSGISRRVAQKTKIELCDLRNAFVNYLQLHNPDNVEQGILTADKVHLSDEGNRLVAEEVLKALGQ